MPTPAEPPKEDRPTQDTWLAKAVAEHGGIAVGMIFVAIVTTLGLLLTPLRDAALARIQDAFNPTEAILSGTIVTDETAALPGGLTVRLTRLDGEDESLVREKTVGATGDYQFSGLEVGTYNVTVLLPGETKAAPSQTLEIKRGDSARTAAPVSVAPPTPTITPTPPADDTALPPLIPETGDTGSDPPPVPPGAGNGTTTPESPVQSGDRSGDSPIQAPQKGDEGTSGAPPSGKAIVTPTSAALGSSLVLRYETQPTTTAGVTNVRVWLEGDPADMKAIHSVTYVLHPTFTPNTIIRDQESGFVLNISSRGTGWTLRAGIMLADGTSVELKTIIDY